MKDTIYNHKLLLSVITLCILTIILFIYGFYRSYNEVDDENIKIYTITQSILHGIYFAFSIILIILLLIVAVAYIFNSNFTDVFLFGGVFLEIIFKLIGALSENL